MGILIMTTIMIQIEFKPNCGRYRSRTYDLFNVNETLYQLS